MDLVLSVLIVVAVQIGIYFILHGRIHQELNATSLLKDVRDEVEGMVRELNLSAERNIGLLETRIEELEVLLAQADQKMVLLNRELERRDRASETYSQLKRPVAAEAPVEAAESAPSLAVTVPTAAAPAEPVIEWKPAPEPARPRPLKERVLDLRDQGASAAAIASATGATLGEVELILSLNPKR